MLLQINKDYFDNPTPPRLFLCQTDKSIIGELKAYAIKLAGKWNQYSELTFSINRTYVDTMTGEYKVDPLFDLAEGLRIIKAEGIGYFQIQDPDTVYSDNESKTINCFSLEYSTSQKYLENFYINTGADESAEVTYWASKFGNDYWNQDNYYKLAGSVFDPYTRYYYKDYTDSDSYVYTEVSISNEEKFMEYDGTTVAKTLYIKSYPNVQFYNPTVPQLSLLHLVFAKIPEWKIGSVDYSLQKQERKFEEERVAVYDFLMNNVSDTFKCIVEWDTMTNTVNFYEEEEDGITEDNTVQSRFDTDIYISRENLASEINIKYSTDNIKTKLKVSGGDDMNIRDVNLGQNYIMNLDYYSTDDWMGVDLHSKYEEYKRLLEETTPKYTEAMQNWVAAYNKWNDLVNAVPADGNVLLVGDPFTKLYCTYSQSYIEAQIEDKRNEMKKAADEYNRLVGYGIVGNVDYNKRPVIYPEEMRVYWPEFDGDAATTYDQGYYATDENETKYALVITPILEDGTILDGQALDTYFDSLNQNDILTSDTKKLIIHIEAEGSSSFWGNGEFDWEGFNDKLVPFKEAHLEAYEEMKKLQDQLASYETNGLLTLEKYLDLYCSRVSYSSTDPIEKRDTEGKMTDNVLLTLIKSDNQSATLRVYYDLVEKVYKVRCDIINTLDGTTVTTKTSYSLGDWSKGKINDSILQGYKIKSIGTLGAYLCLAKDEKVKVNLEDYGINLLKEKHQTYMKIFQTQTEGLLSDAKNKCIVSTQCPTGDIPDGTRWLDTDSNPVRLYTYQSGYLNGEFPNWKEITATEDKIDSKDYARYIENYKKLQAVQEILVEKEEEANMYLNGIQIEGIYLDKDHRDIFYFRKAAEQYFGLTPVNEQLNDKKNVYTFDLTVNEEPMSYVIYLNGDTPYVVYANSQGANLALMNNLKSITNMETYFTEGEWMRLSAFIREDEFSDSNVFLTGYESEEERLSLCNELIKLATKELKTLSQPSLEFSMTMANILAIPEFTPIKNQFKLGNFVRIGLHNNMIKRARLLECDIEFDDLSSFSCTFGNLITTKSEIDIHAELLSQAIQAGKTVASSAANWQKAVDKSNSIDEAIRGGLTDATLNVGKANGQSIEIGQYGIWGRKLVEGTTDQYEPEQFRIMNNRLVFSSDGFETSKSVFGKYVINGEERWGLCSEYVDSGVITGSQIIGGSLKIGTGSTYFQVKEDGSVAIMADGKEAYAGADVVAEIEKARQYHIQVTYSGSTVFNEPGQSSILTCRVYSWDEDITDTILSTTTFAWKRNSSDSISDGVWNSDPNHTKVGVNTLEIKNEDINRNAQFYVDVTFEEL